MENGHGEDRRSFARFFVNLPIKFVQKFSNLSSEGQSIDFSPCGIGMVTPEELKPHSHLDLNVQIPDGHQPLYTQGEVVWSKMIQGNKYAVGVALFKLDLMGMARIVNLVHGNKV